MDGVYSEITVIERIEHNDFKLHTDLSLAASIMANDTLSIDFINI